MSVKQARGLVAEARAAGEDRDIAAYYTRIAHSVGTPMMRDHPSFSHPSNPDIPLWRYMDLSKFISLLQTSKLYFARAAYLGDPFEGSLPRLNTQMADIIIQLRHDVEALASWRDMTEEKIRTIAGQFSDAAKLMVTKIYASCWHMGEHESAAMWKLYSQSSDAICIQTTFAKLAEELPDFVGAGMVEYIDYERDAIPRDNLYNPFLRKRKSFEHETELRALVMVWDPHAPWPHNTGEITEDGSGLLIPVNLNFPD